MKVVVLDFLEGKFDVITNFPDYIANSPGDFDDFMENLGYDILNCQWMSIPDDGITRGHLYKCITHDSGYDLEYVEPLKF